MGTNGTCLQEEEREEEGSKRRARPRREDEDIDYIGIAEGEDRVSCTCWGLSNSNHVCNVCNARVRVCVFPCKVLFFVPSVCVDQQLSVPRQLLKR